MKKFVSLVSVAVLMTGMLFATAGPADAGLFTSVDEKREQVDLSAKQTLERLFIGDDKAQRLYDRAYGYAVFNVTKGALVITGGGGTGVAVHRMTNERTYMHVGMGGIGLGLGGQAFRLIILFEDEATYNNFVRSGWHASSSANAVAGRNGVNAEASFTNGLAIYQITDAGLLLQADIGGTRYWRSKRLNRSAALDKPVRTAAADTMESAPVSSPALEYDYANQTTVYPLETTQYETVEYQSD